MEQLKISYFFGVPAAALAYEMIGSVKYVILKHIRGYETTKPVISTVISNQVLKLTMQPHLVLDLARSCCFTVGSCWLDTRVVIVGYK